MESIEEYRQEVLEWIVVFDEGSPDRVRLEDLDQHEDDMIVRAFESGQKAEDCADEIYALYYL